MDEQTSQLDSARGITASVIRDVWSTLLAAPVIYSVYFLIGYLAFEIGCTLNVLQFEVLQFEGMDMTAMMALVLVLTVIALLLIALYGIHAYRRWRGLSTRDSFAADMGLDTRRAIDPRTAETSDEFLALAGILFALLFGFVTIVSGIALPLLRPCGWI